MDNLVLIHGLLGSLTYYNPAELLHSANPEQPITILAPDLYGYGNQDSIPNLSLQHQVDFINDYLEKALAQQQTDQPCWLAGHSVGGAIAMLFAQQYPEKVKGIINIEGNFSLNDAFWCQAIADKHPDQWQHEYQQLRRDPAAWLTEAGITPTAQRTQWAQTILDYQQASTLHAVATAVVNETGTEDYQTTLKTVANSPTPLHLIAGEHSLNHWHIPPYIQQHAASLTTIDNTGHMMMLEKPQAFCQTLQTIIRTAP